MEKDCRLKFGNFTKITERQKLVSKREREREREDVGWLVGWLVG